MFGYVVPLKSELACADFALYRSFYCGLCKATGRYYGQLPRFTTNYDVTFLSVLLHEYAKTEYRFEYKGCVLNPFKKKNAVCPNELFDKIVAANIILSYYKAVDGVIDREGAKMRVVKSILTKPYQKAVTVLPEADAVCKARYEALRTLEQENCKSPDRVADCFANLLKETAAAVLAICPETITADDAELLNLCYNVGKFVYLADALDDITEDDQKKRYNPFLAAYGGYKSRTDFITANREALTFTLASTVNRAIECFNNLYARFENGGNLLQNILYHGLRGKSDELLNSDKKLKSPRI